ncbi:alpha/beta fold hydrolase [Cumulibacter manganitolerans]|uniref:alpha/beta fold hydrolase n=1 Tax=Cumulibacter manganitolerans TaxID=1884992 RepID=UPI0012956FED|nr:alpha/beta fold hydrolase [Cumulibacter manganitolerans]
MARTFGTPDLVGAIRRELSTATNRARNGISYLTMDKSEGLNPTPRVLVGSRDKVRLWKYPSKNRRHAEPIVAFLGLVSRPYVFDLLPGKSFVGQLGDAGYDVYVLDWGQPDHEESANSMETYVDFYLPRAFKIAQRDSGSPGIHVIAYCFGAIFGLMYQGSRGNSPIRALTTLAAPVDFRKMPVYTQPFQDGSIRPRDVITDEGIVPAAVVARTLAMRTPTYDVTQAVGLWEKLAGDPKSGAIEAHAAMTGWVRDHVNFPGVAFEQFVRDFLNGNGFVNRTARVGNRPVALDRIDIPILSVVAERDDLVPPAASYPLRDLVPEGVYNEVVLPAGHVGLVLGGTAKKITIPAIVDFFSSHSSELGERA